jgi:hypothetical protein
MEVPVKVLPKTRSSGLLSAAGWCVFVIDSLDGSIGFSAAVDAACALMLYNLAVCNAHADLAGVAVRGRAPHRGANRAIPPTALVSISTEVK